MNEEKGFLGTQPVGKLLWKLALPTVAAQIINMLYNIVDRIYIGHIPEIGAMALTGVGVCMPLIMIVTAFAAFAGYGGAPRASIFMGKEDYDSAEKTLGNAFVLQILISAVLTAILLIWNRDFLMAFGASENTIEYAVSYMNIYSIGTIFVQMTLGMNAFITAQGFAKTGMLSVLIGAVANIILDPIFIFGFDMGVRGAALATILSQAMSCIWVLAFLFGKKTHLRLRARQMRLRAKLLFPMMALGLSVFIMQASESVISICFNSSLLKYGGDIAVGAMTILTSVMQFAMLPLQGLGQGAQPIISYNYGARNPERVRAAFRLLLKASLVYSTLLWLCVMIFPQAFAAMFTSEPQLLEFTRTALRIYMACLLLFGIQIACQMTFTSLGNAKASILVAVMRKFILLIPLIYVLPLIFTANQTTAVYMAEPIADFMAVTFTAILFAFQFKKAMAQISEPKSDIGLNKSDKKR
ncbi:MAG: MATE family efflux transporter [Clostridia bacterium]